MNVLMVLPALTEATSPLFRPVKYSLFPPLGLAQLAAFLPPDANIRLVDEHVEPALPLDAADAVPDLVVIQAYITSAARSYAIADHYRSRGAYVCLGGLHVTSLPAEAAPHADTIFLGPGEQTFPLFLTDLAAKTPEPRYDSSHHPRTLVGVSRSRRDLIKRELYLVPNSLSVTRGCPHHCDFCYKDAFFEGGKSFYTRAVDSALAEIAELPGRHLYFLDDHILGHRRFGEGLFEGMRGMNRLFQGAATVDSILQGDLIERAANAGMRSVFVGFETLDEANLAETGKRQNLGRDYAAAIRRLDDLGIMINGSFVFGLDADGPDVFKRTVDWAVRSGITTATFHVATPYPGTGFHRRMESQGRILHRDWSRYDTRQTVFQPARMTPQQLEDGYWWAYKSFYSWRNIARAATNHATVGHRCRHFAYAAGWKKFEPLWGATISFRQLRHARRGLEAVLKPNSRRATSEKPVAAAVDRARTFPLPVVEG